MFSNLLSAANALDSFEPIAKWLTIGVVAALIVTGIILFFAEKATFKTYFRYALPELFVYLLVVGIAFFALDLAKHYSDEYAEENWLDKGMLIRYVLIPLCVFAAVSLLSLALFAILSKKRPSAKKAVGIIGGILSVIALIAALVCIAVYYNLKIANDGYYNSDTASVKQLALYLSALLLIVLIVGLTFFDRQNFRFDTKSLAYAGVCVAMSFALSYIKLWEMPQGGSVTLMSLLPVMIYSYMFGAKKGVFAGFVYGILQAVQDPWLIHPAQFLLDYPVAFSTVGLASLFRDVKAFEKIPQVSFTLGAVIASLFRFVSHVLSGVFAFEAYAGGKNVWIYSLGYNSFVFIDIAIVIVAGILVFSSKTFVLAINRIAKTKPAVPQKTGNTDGAGTPDSAGKAD